MFIVITAEGGFEVRDEQATTAAIDQIVGPEGWATVRLNPATNLAGWVNDCGLLYPDRYPRNIVGSCLLATMGGGQQPYAGPVILTGWQTGHGVEIRPLSVEQLGGLRTLYSEVRAALGIGPDADLVGPPGWAAELRRFAEFARTVEAVPGGDR
jgi:hypothetical protein